MLSEEVGQTGRRILLYLALWLAGQGRHGAVDLEEEERKRQGERSAAFQGSGFRPGDREGPSRENY